MKRQDASTGQLVDVDGRSDTPTSSQPVMQVKVYSPYRVYFDEPAHSVSATNATGPFDVLPHHHNFLTLLIKGEMIIETLHGQQKITISGGLMHVRANKVVVFLNI